MEHDGRGFIEDLGEYRDRPEGSELNVDVVNEDDDLDLDEEERAKRHAALDRSWDQAQQGKFGRPFSEILKDL